jgi:phosphopantothenoylcysteine decarboxylase/phosphopantothenate--cysteine ligase
MSRKILLAITGGVAAYKTPDLVRRLKEAHFAVKIVLTEAAKSFVAPLALQALVQSEIYDSLFDLKSEMSIGHIELARWRKLLVIVVLMLFWSRGQQYWNRRKNARK